MDRHPTNCAIEQVGKQRNGKPRYWCSVHGASATGRYGARLAACEGAYLHAAERSALEIDPADYPGGIAIWGAVAPVFDTTNIPAESGIHVHARGTLDDKEIDNTFDAVVIRHRRDLLDEQRTRITSEVAVNFYLSRFAGREIRILRCPRCGEGHLDSGYFAVKPHRRHLCHGCGNYFTDTGKAVSNPIAALYAQSILHAASQSPVRAPQSLDIKQADCPGGIQVWASNPALVWTADRPEQEGLHVHAFAAPDKIIVDETFDQVRVDGVLLDESHVRYLMAQSSLPHLANKIVSLTCSECGCSHFDQGDHAFFPHIEHECEGCGARFVSRGRRRMVVSNPFVRIRDTLYGRVSDGRKL